MKKARILILLVLVIIGLIGYGIWWMLKPPPMPEPSREETGVIKTFREDPDVIAIVWLATGPHIFDRLNETLDPPLELSFFERLFLNYIQNSWVIIRRAESFFPGWTWVVTIPVPSAFSRLIETFGAKLPASLKMRKKEPHPMCQDAFILTGLHHAWGNSLEFNFCSNRMIVSPELYSWEDMWTSLVRSDFYPVPEDYKKDQTLALYWVRPGKVTSEMLSPILRAYTARVFKLYHKVVNPDTLVYGKVLETDDKKIHLEINMIWPPLRIPSDKLPLPNR